jgi:hypothetical protein
LPAAQEKSIKSNRKIKKTQIEAKEASMARGHKETTSNKSTESLDPLEIRHKGENSKHTVSGQDHNPHHQEGR